MSWKRIYGLLVRYLYIYPRSVPRILDIFFWPIVNLLIWGFLTLYLQQFKTPIPNVINLLLGALVFWEFIQRSQLAVSIAFLEEIWERNLINIFVTPIKLSEFLVATVFVGVVRLFLISTVLLISAWFLFHFNIFIFGYLLIPFVINLFMFGWILGLVSTSLILRFGQSAQVLAFSLTMILQPFVAVFYPVRVLPSYLQPVSFLIPASHIFEGMRSIVINHSFDVRELWWASGLNIIWLILALIIFFNMFEYVREKGQLLKLVD